MKYVLIVVAMLFASAVNAATSYQAEVVQANCVLIQQDTSLSGGLVGGAVGGVGGALVGSLFGKSGKKWGALAGGVGGAAYGSRGNKVYNCTVLVRIGEEQHMVSKQSSEEIYRGQRVTVVDTGNGQLTLM